MINNNRLHVILNFSQSRKATMFSELKKITFKIFLSLNLFIASHSYGVEVAITVDDLPVAGNIPTNTTRLELTHKMISILKKHNISGVYAMTNAAGINTEPDGIKILNEWVNSGHFLGNHTYSHIDIVKNTVQTYAEDIKKNELILKNIMKNNDYKIFRYPFLAEGETLEKRDLVRNYLFENGYKIAEVTMDFFDYAWNDALTRCIEKNDLKSIKFLKETYLKQSTNSIFAAQTLSKLLFDRDIKHILLIHIGIMNVEMLDEMLTNFEQNGVKFISLQDAMSDSVYKIDPKIARDRTFTFLNQIRLQKKLENPPFVKKFYGDFPEEILSNICL